MLKGSQPAILAGDRARDNARCSTDSQDLTAQQEALIGLGDPPDRVSVDHGLTGTNRTRPGLREAMVACRPGDTLVVTKLDRERARRDPARLTIRLGRGRCGRCYRGAMRRTGTGSLGAFASLWSLVSSAAPTCAARATYTASGKLTLARRPHASRNRGRT